MMGGELRLESEPNQGSTFSFVITVATGNSEGTKAAKGRVTASEPPDHGQHILVVDDIPEARLLVRSLLEPLGFRVSEAADAADAEAKIASEPPDLVFMDWFLPDDNGLELIKRLRSRSGISQPRLVMLTANATKESRQQALQTGADDFLSKPFEEDELFRILEKHLPLQLTRESAQMPQSAHASPNAVRQISADDLVRLSSEARASLSQAALSLNPEKISEALHLVARENPEFAARLGEFANTRQYQALWQVLGILEAEE
jgi:CheY-like chemotaxis protein